MGSFLSLHVQSEDLPAVVQLVQSNLPSGLTAYLTLHQGWVSLWHEWLEAEEDWTAINTLLASLSRLGRAAAFLVLENEELWFTLADNGAPSYRYPAEMDGASWSSPAPLDLDTELLAAALAVQPRTSGVTVLAGLLGLSADYATVGFDDWLELDEESELPEEILVLEGQ